MEKFDVGQVFRLAQLTADRTKAQDQAIASILKLLDETSAVTLLLCEKHPELRPRAETLKQLRQNFA
jgi:hypothetical protein